VVVLRAAAFATGRLFLAVARDDFAAFGAAFRDFWAAFTERLVVAAAGRALAAVRLTVRFRPLLLGLAFFLAVRLGAARRVVLRAAPRPRLLAARPPVALRPVLRPAFRLAIPVLSRRLKMLSLAAPAYLDCFR
jgi:hypothetical protein